jgi:cobalt-precorrin-5B (C1)-methyltransferase
MTGDRPAVIGIRLPAGYYFPVAIVDGGMTGRDTWISVIKDGGDDPDVTHGAEIRVHLRCLPGEISPMPNHHSIQQSNQEERMERKRLLLCLVGGEGVGVATKPGLPVLPGEPAINPTPRDMMALNLWEELQGHSGENSLRVHSWTPWSPPAKPHVLLPGFRHSNSGSGRPVDSAPSVSKDGASRGMSLLGDDGSAERRGGFSRIVEVEIEVPEGGRLARHTLNPRLGIEGGISILGTTGLVRPFSHEAYEETIQTELSVARSNGCETVVLSTGGKSEHYAQRFFPSWPEEAFVQIADFFAFSIREARKMGFRSIVHSVFFGKAVKMAQGHEYTHAHKSRLDLGHLAGLCRAADHDPRICREVENANTARQALDILLREKAMEVVFALVRAAVDSSCRIADGDMQVRLLLFNHDGTLLADVNRS